MMDLSSPVRYDQTDPTQKPTRSAEARGRASEACPRPARGAGLDCGLTLGLARLDFGSQREVKRTLCQSSLTSEHVRSGGRSARRAARSPGRHGNAVCTTQQ